MSKSKGDIGDNAGCAVVALGFFALVGFICWLCMR